MGSKVSKKKAPPQLGVDNFDEYLRAKDAGLLDAPAGAERRTFANALGGGGNKGNKKSSLKKKDAYFTRVGGGGATSSSTAPDPSGLSSSDDSSGRRGTARMTEQPSPDSWTEKKRRRSKDHRGSTPPGYHNGATGSSGVESPGQHQVRTTGYHDVYLGSENAPFPSEEQDTIFEWQDDKGGWHRFEQKHADILRNARVRNYPTIKFYVGNQGRYFYL